MALDFATGTACPLHSAVSKQCPVSACRCAKVRSIWTTSLMPLRQNYTNLPAAKVERSGCMDV